MIKYLDPEYIDRIAVPDASKLQFILAGILYNIDMGLEMWELGVGTEIASLLVLVKDTAWKLCSVILA